MISCRHPAPPRATGGAALFSLAFLLGIVALGWWRTLADAARMSPMLDGLVGAGRAMPFDTSPARFAATWTAMMAAMMLPGFVVAIATGRKHWLPHPLHSGAMALAYLFVWMSTATIAFGALTALNVVSHPVAWLDRIGGAIVAVAGAYQLTGYKRRFLTDHRSHNQTLSAAVAFGLSEGLRCLGSSWALMSVLLVVGVMNPSWMGAIGAICLGEKVLPRRVAVATGVGLVLIGMGVVVVIHPQVLHLMADPG